MTFEKSRGKTIERYLNSIGAYWVKNHGSAFSRKGIADYTVCYRGDYYAFEVKNDEGKESLVQRLQRERVIRAGGIARVVRSKDEVRTIIEKRQKERRKEGR